MSNGAQTRIERSRAKIVAAAADIFLNEGFLGATMDDIASRAGVSVQTIYSRFQSKEKLFHEVVAALAGGATRSINRDLDDQPVGIGPEDWLRRFAIKQLGTVLTPRLMQLRRMVIGESGRFPELGVALYKEGPGRAIERLTEAITFYVARGELDVKDATLAAQQFNWLLMGGPTSEVMHLGDAAIPSRRQMEKHAEQTVDLFLAKYTVTQRSRESTVLGPTFSRNCLSG